MRAGRDRRGREHLQPRGARLAGELGQEPLDPAVDADDDGPAADVARRRRHAVAGELDAPACRSTAARRAPARAARAAGSARAAGPTPSPGMNTPSPLGPSAARAGKPSRSSAASWRAQSSTSSAEAGIRSEPTRRTIGPSSASSRSSSASDARVDAGRALAPPRATASWWNGRAAGEQEAAVAPAAPPAIGPASIPRPSRRRPARRRPRRARSRRARRRTRRRSTSPASAGGFAQAAGSPQTGVAADGGHARGILRGDAHRAATLRLGVPAGRRRRRGRAGRGRRRSRAGNAARGLPLRDLSDARRRPGRAGLVQPDPRGVLPLDGFRASRSLRRSARRFTVTADRAFGAVVEGCADPRRPGGWITAEVRGAYVRLHELGWAHSIEVVGRGRRARRRALRRRARRAVRGGVMFHVPRTRPRWRWSRWSSGCARPAARALLDVQWTTPHLRTLGRARRRARRRTWRRLPAALDAPPAFAPQAG